jgi:hypothetical protein
MKTKLDNVVQAYAAYLDSLGDFINATDDKTREKLIGFDIIEMLSIDLGEQIEEVRETLINNN